MDKFYQIVDKIGKQNFILVVFIFIVIVVTGLYQTFSLFTSTDGSSLIDGIMTYKFILNSDNTENSITVASGSSKNVMMTVSNPEDLKLKYGVYYSSSDDLSSVSLGYLSTSEHKGMDLIDAKSDYIISLKVTNNSSSDVTITFGVAYGVENGGDLLLDTGKHWLGEAPGPLAEKAVGSYVKYTGNNGCSGKACEGQNANYVDSSNMGYCLDDETQFDSNGWRVAYISDGTAYLTSGGSPECMSTDRNGVASNEVAPHYEETEGSPKHLANLNAKSLTYCNSTYAYGGVCNSSSAWNMNDFDFQKITGDTLSTAANKSEEYYDNYSILNNYGFYWFAATNTSEDSLRTTFYWEPYSRSVYSDYSNGAYGVRPVLRFQSSVMVTGGSGTMDDPYVISNG